MAEIGIRNGWKYDSYKKSFLIQEVSSLYNEKGREVGCWFSSRQDMEVTSLSLLYSRVSIVSARTEPI
jgi:hypothetical protein